MKKLVALALIILTIFNSFVFADGNDDRMDIDLSRLTTQESSIYEKIAQAYDLSVSGKQEAQDRAVLAYRRITVDKTVKTSIKILVARALYNLNHGQGTHVTKILCEILKKDNTKWYDKMAACYALKECGSNFQEIIAKHFLTPAYDPTLTDKERIVAAGALHWFGSEYQEAQNEATAVILSILQFEKTLASMALAKFGPGHEKAKNEAVRCLAEFAMNEGFEASSRMSAAHGLSNFGPAYEHITAQAYYSLLIGANVDAYHKIRSAELLARLGPQYQGYKSDAIGMMYLFATTSPETSSRIKAAAALSKYQRCDYDAAEILLSIATTDPSLSHKIEAAKTFSLFGPGYKQYQDEAVEFLLQIARNPRNQEKDRSNAAHAAAEFGSTHQNAIEEALNILMSIIIPGSIEIKEASMPDVKENERNRQGIEIETITNTIKSKRRK